MSSINIRNNEDHRKNQMINNILDEIRLIHSDLKAIPHMRADLKEIKKIMTELSDLQAQVAATIVEEGAAVAVLQADVTQIAADVAQIADLVAQLAAAGTVPQALVDMTTALKASSDALTAAVTPPVANTPSV